MVTIPTGTWVDNQVDAGELRKALGASLVLPAGPVAPRPGRLAGPGTPLAVTPTTPATMSVLVKAGKAHTYRSAAYGPILGLGPDGDVTIPLVAPGTGSQWFRIYLNQRDTSAPANDTDSLAVVDVVAGTAAASPTKPNLPAGALLLGEVLIPAGASSITAGMVTDLPTYTAPRGGVLPVANQAERVALTTAGLVWPTLEVLELDTGRRLWHDGARFRYEGDRAVVASATDRTNLTAYAGLAAWQSDVRALYIHDGTTWAPSALYCALIQTVSQGIAVAGTNGWVDILYNGTGTEIADPFGMHDPNTNPQRITVPVRGIYRITGGVAFAGDARGDRGVRVAINNVAGIPGSVSRAKASDVYSTSVPLRSITIGLNAGDFVHQQAVQTVGASISTVVDNTIGEASTFTVELINTLP